MSPGRSRGSSRATRRSTRAVPWTPGRASTGRRRDGRGKSSSRPMLSTAIGVAGRRPSGAFRRHRRQDRARPGRPSRAARGRGPGRCRTPPCRRASGTAPARGPRRSRTVSPEVVTVPSLDFSTTTCRSAYAATCGRWVTTRTWAVRASSASRRPTSTAAAPPTPASTSSKTNVGHRAGAGQRDLEGQHHPGQLAARGALVRAAAARSRCWPPAGARPRRPRRPNRSQRVPTEQRAGRLRPRPRAGARPR